MDIWIIRNGEKIGPIHDFEVRRQIANGELPATTPAWHEGLPEWKPLVEIDLFTREFELPSTPEPSPLASDDSSETNFTPPPLTAQTHYGRRFWARWLDLTLYSGVWWIGMWAAGQNIEAALINPWVMIFQYVPWFILEALLLHQFRTTPGKWLLGLQVVNKDGSTLSLAASSRRSMRVLFSGIGFGWSILALPSPQLVHGQAPRQHRLGSNRRPPSHRRPAAFTPHRRALRPIYGSPSAPNARRRSPPRQDRWGNLSIPQNRVRKKSPLAPTAALLIWQRSK
jgi:uncharacterized RDD family membrane protein YckC